MYKACNGKTGNHLELKRFRMKNDKDGVRYTSKERFIWYWQHVFSFQPQSCREIKSVMVAKGSIYLLLGHMNHVLLVSIHVQFWSSSSQVFVQRNASRSCIFTSKKDSFYRDIRRLVTKCVIPNNYWLDWDLLGSNLLINKEGQCKIVDTGLARVFVITL